METNYKGKTSPNQRKITINKAPCNKDNLYAMISIESIEIAMQNLTKAGSVKLWLYLAKNQNKYNFWLSSEDVCLRCGITDGTYRSAFKDLINQGFLVETAKNQFTFYEQGI